MELSSSQFHHIMQRFPNFELSYETLSHKKVSLDYDVCLAIPIGKKSYLWFTFYQDRDVCVLLDLNREKKIVKATILKISCPKGLELGTVIYGTVITEQNETVTCITSTHFVIEDIFFYNGISIQKSLFHEKLQFLVKAMPMLQYDKNQTIQIYLPMMWEFDKLEDGTLPQTLPPLVHAANNIQEPLAPLHHIQYRSFRTIMPHLNVFLSRKPHSVTSIIEPKEKLLAAPQYEPIPYHRMDFNKPQYKYPTVFRVIADIQFDIYHLFAYGKNSQHVYYNMAYVPNCKTSAFMNGIFRNIRENKNLDYIEESDDESEFENIAEDRFVDLKKVAFMECVFNTKFKKWTPMRVVNRSSGTRDAFKVVHVSSLVR